MTKEKSPLSIEGALARIAGQVPGDYAALSTIADRTVGTIYNWGNPDTPESIPLAIAIQFDIAFQRAGGQGTPIFDAYASILDLERRQTFADQAELARLAGIAVKENAEATLAHIACTLPGATHDDWRTAIRETEEAVVANTDTLALLREGAGHFGAERAASGEGPTTP